MLKHVTISKSIEVPPMEEVIGDGYGDRHENQGRRG